MKVSIMSKNGSKIVDLNRRKAIREKCLNCSTWYPSDLEKCRFTDCPLYLYRMGKGKQNPKTRKKAIRSYCLWCMADKWSEVIRCVSQTCPLFIFRKSRVESTPLPKIDHIEASLEEKTLSE